MYAHGSNQQQHEGKPGCKPRVWAIMHWAFDYRVESGWNGEIG